MRVENATVTDAGIGFGQFEINDGSGVTLVDDQLYFYTLPANGSIYHITGVVDYSLDATLIYPNPSKGIINIETVFEGQLNVLILNLQGEVVLEQTVDNNYRQVNVSNLSNGTYVLSVTDNTTNTIVRECFILTH